MFHSKYFKPSSDGKSRCESSSTDMDHHSACQQLRRGVQTKYFLCFCSGGRDRGEMSVVTRNGRLVIGCSNDTTSIN
jgi:hypothetical protein